MIAPLKKPKPAEKRKLAEAAAYGAGVGGRTKYFGHAVGPANVAGSSLAGLSARHVIRDGEIILLILKPSRWYIGLHSIGFALAVLIILCPLQLSHLPQAHLRYFVDAGLFAVSCRLMWATLMWMGRLYVLTDRRILRFSGVFHMEVLDCPLRKVAVTHVIRGFSERLLHLGTIEIQAEDEDRLAPAWQTINHPVNVHDQIVAAIRKAKQGACGETEAL